MLLRLSSLIIITLLLSACGPHHVKFPQCGYFSETDSCVNVTNPRIFAIFFDGTGNTEKSYSNISKLHSIISLQNKPNIYTLYVAGVGTEISRLISGNLFGNGLDERVKLAYRFLLTSGYNKSRGDEIFIFGFSRGAYTARVLAGLIYTADIPNVKDVTDSEDIEVSDKLDVFINQIYTIYKDTEDVDIKRNTIQSIPGYIVGHEDVRISYMGLFDTVPALRYDPNAYKKIGILSDVYEDQICNVDKVSHAMSIDDNRGSSFPPSPMKVTAIASGCKGINNDTKKIEELISKTIHEVWFSGAHSDVGGGYSVNVLSGVTLNWMLRQMKAYAKTNELLPENPFVYEDVYGPSHIGEDSILSGGIYRNRTREIPIYMDQLHEGHKTLMLHSSVIERRQKVPRTMREFNFNPIPTKEAPAVNYRDCFSEVPSKDPNVTKNLKLYNATLNYEPSEEETCFEIDEPDHYKLN